MRLVSREWRGVDRTGGKVRRRHSVREGEREIQREGTFSFPSAS